MALPQPSTRSSQRKQKSKVLPQKINRFHIKVCPVISKDSKHIICASGNIVGIFNLRTSALVSLFTKHEEAIHAIFLNERNPNEVISSCKKHVYIWDYTDHSVTKKIEHEERVIYFLPNPVKKDIFYTVIKGKKKNFKFVRNEILKKEKVTGDVIGSVSYSNCCCSVHSSGEYVAFIKGNQIHIYREANSKTIVLEYDEKNLTCISFHPRLTNLAVGDKSGRIIIWSKIRKSSPLALKLHWHHSSLNSLMFLNDGEFLLSGGKEGVLVIWHLKSEEKSFVPRVGGVVENLFKSSDSHYIGMHLQNNSLKILSTLNYGLSRAITFLSKAANSKAGLKYHKKLDCLVVNGSSEGVIQLYHPKSDSVKLSVDLLKENFIASVDNRAVCPTLIDKIAISSDGRWMATVDVREDKFLVTERKLKLWEFDSTSKNFSLNCVVDPPHSADVCALEFKPQDFTYYTLLSTSKDGTIKTWMLQSSDTGKDKEKKSHVWQIHSIAHDSAGENSSRKAAFSADGSIVAILFSEVTLWDPEDLTFQSRLPWHYEDSNIIDMFFGFHESSHMLLIYSSKYIVAWDLQSMTMKWQLSVKTNLSLADPSSSYIVAFVQKQHRHQILVLDPNMEKPRPLSVIPIEESSSPLSAVIIEGVMSEGTDTLTDRLYYLNPSGDILGLRNDNFMQEILLQQKEEISGATNYDEIFGKKSNAEAHDISAIDDIDLPLGCSSSKFVKQMMSTPSHILPSADNLCRGLLKCFLNPRHTSQGISNDSEVQVDNAVNTENVVEDLLQTSDEIHDKKLEKKERIKIQKDGFFDFVKDCF